MTQAKAESGGDQEQSTASTTDVGESSQWLARDPWLLGYSRHGQTLHAHYPTRDASGATSYGAGLAFDHAPEMRRSPDSARSALWRDMLAVHSVSAAGCAA